MVAERGNFGKFFKTEGNIDIMNDLLNDLLKEILLQIKTELENRQRPLIEFDCDVG